ncbi:hypothetical protein BGE01nite_36050 [Brevifollis gellanilyticus]|uniref:Serine protease n=2 Tax=Brevifollis gellanilyticus TaxID=748831 RepID=A0A512MC47_9BACT|nr:hypothetical protein BGE01nite_36050 [Brevifollis gellanilyticus]
MVEFTFKGAELDEAKSVLLSSLSGGKSMTIPVKQVPAKKGVLAAQLPADAAPGLYDIRLVARFGVSNPRVFQISAADVVESPGTNTKSDKAVAVTAASVIQGTFKAAVPHWFSFDGRKDQRLIGSFTGSGFDVRTSLVGGIYDASGRELARMRDGLVDVKFPADGTYKIKVHDLMFATGDDYGYRLTLTTGPVVWAKGKDEVYGWNLPGGQVVSGLRVNRGQPLEHLKVDAATMTKLVTASPLKVFTLPENMEAASKEGVTPIAVGQTISGWFPANGAAKVFELNFKAGDRINLEVTSQQLGFTTDPNLLVENVKGETVTAQGEVNDLAGLVPAPSTRILSLDPTYAYDSKADGVFRISVSDPSNAANGRRYPFQLCIRKTGEPALDGAVAVNAKLPPAAAIGPHEIPSANLWRGGILALEVYLPNRTGMNVATEVPIGNLPVGVTSLGGFVAKGQSLGHIALRASADAPAGAAALSGISSTASLVWPVKDTGRETMHVRMAGAPVIGVVPDTAPATLEAALPNPVEVAVDGKVDVPLKVTRQSNCTDAIKLKALGLTDPAKAPEVTIAAKANEGKLSLDLKTLKLLPGEYGVLLQGPVKVVFQRKAEDIAAAQSTAKRAAEAQAAAKKALDEAKVLKPEDEAGKTAQEAKIKELTAALTKTDKAKADADKAAKELVTKNPAKDATFIVYSTPIRLKVVAKK